MRPISADLQAVQQVRSPRARVTCTVEPFSPHGPGFPPVEWSELVSNAGQSSFNTTALVALDDGTILKFVAGPTALQKYTITNPSQASSWTGATPTTLASGLMFSVAALRIPNTSTIRVFYINGSNNVLYIESTNNGASWSSPVTVYNGGNAADDLVLAYIADGIVQNGPWFAGFSTYNSGTGQYSANFAYQVSGLWTVRTYSSPGWRAAGISAYAAIPQHHFYVFRQLDSGTSRLRRLTESGGTFSEELDIDQTQAGRFGLHLAAYRFIQLPRSGVMMGICVETAYQGRPYVGVCGIQNGNDELVDEPIIFTSIATADDTARPALAETPAGDLYLAGDTVVWRGAKQPATTDTLIPIRYRYEDNTFEIEFEAGIDTLYVGQLLVITRTLSWGNQSGSETIRAWIVRVERGTDKVKVRAVDALGYLGIARTRRPAILQDGSYTNLTRTIKRLCARVGLPAAADDNNLNSAPGMPFTAQPMENLLSAFHRVRSQQACYLVPANSGQFAVTIINPPTSNSGHYDDQPHNYGDSPSQQPLIRAAEVSDFRQLGFAYVMGTFSTDPEDGGSVGMANGPTIPNTRPISYSLTNQRYNNSSRVIAAAQAEAERQHKLPVAAYIEANANLALELYDIVEVDEPRLGWSDKQFRVRAIREDYDRGRLTQTILLGPTN